MKNEINALIMERGDGIVQYFNKYCTFFCAYQKFVVLLHVF